MVLLQLLEPSVHQSLRPANYFALPPIDSILDFCKNRDDFPQHLVQSGYIMRKRRRSLVKDFLTFGNPRIIAPYEKPEISRRRALSVDGQVGFKVTTWFKSQNSDSEELAISAPPQELTPPISFRRHSMIENSPDDVFASSKKGIIRPWTIDEDNTLLEAVKKLGPQWTKISFTIPGRNRRQCKEHWFRVLSKRPCARGLGPTDAQADDHDAGIFESAESRRGLWSPDEDAQLIRAYQELGPRWPLIASRVQGRNQRQCEKRFRRLPKIQCEESNLSSKTPPQTLSNSLSALADLATSN